VILGYACGVAEADGLSEWLFCKADGTNNAVRSRISSGNVGDAVKEAIGSNFDISHLVARAHEALTTLRYDYEITAFEQRRPFVLLRPAIFPDGNEWCALYGENLQEGVAGFGETPEKAAIAFDLAWLNSKAAITGPVGSNDNKRHRHVNSGIQGDDSCAHCGRDLRDEIHWRINKETGKEE
jgi:hypothetical protein